MSSLMLVNPRKRKSHRSPAQKAATRRMLAARHGKRASNPIRRKRSTAKRRSNPIRTTRHVYHKARRSARRRSNPLSLGGMSGMTGMLMNGLKGAGGAVVVNVVTNYLPDAVKTGNTVYLTRAAIALLLGTVGRKVLGNNARAMAEGALAVNFHDAINTFAGAMLPGSQMHGMGVYMNGVVNPELPHANVQYVDSELDGMGEYMFRGR
jgi:hypothetical protein